MPIETEQLFVSAAFYYLAVVEHTYKVGIPYGAQAVCYYYRGTVFHQTVEGTLHKPLRLCIESRRSFVEYHYRRVFQHGTGYTDSLPLPSRQTTASVADICLVTVLGSHYEVVSISNTGCLLYLFTSGILYTECYIVFERIVEKYRLLIDIAHKRA